MSKQKRNRLVHSYYDAGIGKHQIFVYNKKRELVVHLMITPNGNIEIIKGKKEIE